MTLWTDKDSPRIWRCADSHFYGDEPGDAVQVYTDEVLADIAAQGFNGIWLRGRLYELMQSTVFPQLNDRDTSDRLASVRKATGQSEQAPKRTSADRLSSVNKVIKRGKKYGIGVYLFFNEPLALASDDTFWNEHPDLKGSAHTNPIKGSSVRALCTSTPKVQEFLGQAIESVLAGLPDLTGIILITATEYHSHCWAHTMRRKLNDGVEHNQDKNDIKPDCPRCAEKEPAEIVLKLLTKWRDIAQKVAPDVKVLAWNWSWSIWYEDPQSEIVSNLPEGIELLVDFERGGQRNWRQKNIPIDEYSLSYPGPSERFLTTQKTAPKGTLVNAKLQIGTTHEMATVPNLPLIKSLHTKMVNMTDSNVTGAMASWNFGNTVSLNTFAFGLYQNNPKQYKDYKAFISDLADKYFGVKDTAQLETAWEKFNLAFEDYPFSIAFLYFGPINDGPAHILSLNYKAKKYGGSWVAHEPDGDDPTNYLGGFDLNETTKAVIDMARDWQEGLEYYDKALETSSSSQLRCDGGLWRRPAEVDRRDACPTDNSAASMQLKRKADELRCAKMIGIQLQSAANQLEFRARTVEIIGKDSIDKPTTLPADKKLIEIMQSEIENARVSLPLVKQDPRLGFHQEPHIYMYDENSIKRKIKTMEKEIEKI